LQGAALSPGVTVSKSDPKIEINIGRRRLSGYVPVNAIDLHTSSWVTFLLNVLAVVVSSIPADNRPRG
jgi:hypothetical protein